jgi:hypothetical protein
VPVRPRGCATFTSSDLGMAGYARVRAWISFVYAVPRRFHAQASSAPVLKGPDSDAVPTDASTRDSPAMRQARPVTSSNSLLWRRLRCVHLVLRQGSSSASIGWHNATPAPHAPDITQMPFSSTTSYATDSTRVLSA